MAKNINGFTLVELAIALMVIGLLIGGVLKGQELIENARVTSFIRQIKAYDTATLIFRNTYGALPGDIKRPSRVPNCIDAPCNVAGNGNGKISEGGDPQERFNFFVHLTKAGMIQGPEGGTTAEMDAAMMDVTGPESELFFPRFALDTIEMFYAQYTGMTIGTLNKEHNSYFFRWLKNHTADQLDTKIDNGSACSGDMYSRAAALCDPDNLSVSYTELDEEAGAGEHMIFLWAEF